MPTEGMDSFYAYPSEAVEKVRSEKAWVGNAKYFTNVKIGPSALIKMLSHGQQGVEKGIRKSGKPVEVMGLLMGRPGTDDVHSIVITDAFPLPIEGFETRVVADDNTVINYMIELGESMEHTRKEKFCGWYHTHPFDLDGTSHCFLSNTDISTQLQWQRSEDPHGNPWLAIVIDPLLSLARNAPELMAFRVYPPEYTAPTDETPNGQIVRDDRKRIEQWGACWNRYYQLEVQFFVSAMAEATLHALRNKFLWYGPLVHSPDVSRTWQEIHKLSRPSKMAPHPLPSSSSISAALRGGKSPEESGESDRSAAELDRTGSGGRAANAVLDVAANHVCRLCSLAVKQVLFSGGATCGMCEQRE